nr:hypothetical protein [Thiococcus pfennigii]
MGGTGLGSIESDIAGIDCGDDCGEDYPIDTAVTLTATPEAGHGFAGWGGDCSGTQATCQLTMATAREVTATFTAPIPDKSLTVTLTGDGVGTVTSTPAGIDCGDDCGEDYPLDTPVTLTATPEDGHGFAGWGGDCAGAGNCLLTMSQDAEVTANFVKPPEEEHRLVVERAGSGAVESDDGRIACPPDCEEVYASPTDVVLMAKPDSGWLFEQWEGACSGRDVCAVRVEDLVTVAANFIPASQGQLLMVEKTGSGTVTSDDGGIDCGNDCSESYVYRALVELSAEPDSGWVFDGWSGACSGTGSCSVEMTTAKTAIANFSPVDACPAELAVLGETGSGDLLSLLTAFRDQALAGHPNGDWMIRAYYRHAGEVSARLASDAGLRRQALGLLYRLREDLAQMARGVTPDLAAGDRAAIRAFAANLQRGASTGLAEDLRRFLALDWSEPRNGRAKNGE